MGASRRYSGSCYCGKFKISLKYRFLSLICDYREYISSVGKSAAFSGKVNHRERGVRFDRPFYKAAFSRPLQKRSQVIVSVVLPNGK